MAVGENAVRRPYKTELVYATFLPHILRMSTKQIVQELLERLPENASLNDVAREIEFVAVVRQGLAELDAGKGIPMEEIERELPSWVIK